MMEDQTNQPLLSTRSTDGAAFFFDDFAGSDLVDAAFEFRAMIVRLVYGARQGDEFSAEKSARSFSLACL